MVLAGKPEAITAKTNTKIKNFGASWLSEKASACSFIRKIKAKKRIISVVAKKIRKRIPKFALGMSKMISDGHDAFISNTKTTTATVRINGDKKTDLNSAALSLTA